jgi:hypothetical protein
LEAAQRIEVSVKHSLFSWFSASEIYSENKNLAELQIPRQSSDKVLTKFQSSHPKFWTSSKYKDIGCPELCKYKDIGCPELSYSRENVLKANVNITPTRISF